MRRPEFCLLPFVLDGLPGAAGGMLRIWPHQAAGEGHFVALLERRGEGEGCESAAVKPFTETQNQADLCRAVNDALPDWSAQALYASAVHASKAVMLPPDCPDVQGFRCRGWVCTWGACRVKRRVRTTPWRWRHSPESACPWMSLKRKPIARGSRWMCVPACPVGCALYIRLAAGLGQGFRW